MSDKERLENMTTFDERLKDIKDFFLGDNEVAGALYDTSEIGELDPEVKEYIKWLIQQAERVEELEKDLNEWRNEALRWIKLFEEYQELNKRYREALEFYADEKSWMNREVTILMDGEPTDVGDCPAIFDDGGNIARKALEGEE